jgi:hypothetical protein
MPDLVNAAHKALEFQPGEGVATDVQIRKIAQSLKTLVLSLVEIRNLLGTGHGRAAPTPTTPEHAQITRDAARLWTTWALRRLEPYIVGNVTALVRDLDGSIFTKGALANRLKAANLDQLTEDDQRRVGLAVGSRSARGTFVVAEDGVDAANPDNPKSWPPAYIEGVVMGLFFDANGYVDLGEWPRWAMRQLARLTAGSRDGLEQLRRLDDRLTRAVDSERVVSDSEKRTEAAREASAAAAETSDSATTAVWEHIAQLLRPN